MPLSDVLARCIDNWTAQGIEVAPPISEHEVRRVWERLGMELSADVLELYSFLGGFQDYVADEEFVWSLCPPRCGGLACRSTPESSSHFLHCFRLNSVGRRRPSSGTS